MKQFINKIQNNNYLKFGLFFINDFLLCFFASFLTFVLRYESISFDFNRYIFASTLSFIIFIPLLIKFKLYFQLSRYFSLNTAIFYIKIFLLYSILSIILIFIVYNFYLIPRSYPIVQPVIYFILFIGNRFLINFILNINSNNKNIKNVLIYGSGEKATKLANNIQSNFRLKAFIDITSNTNNTLINGIKIYNLNDIDLIIISKKIHVVIVALDDLTRFNKKNIIKKLFQYNISLLQLDSKNNLINLSQEIDIGSLLFRSETSYKINLDYKNKNILVSGGGGSIGSEICRQTLILNPKFLLIVDISEYNLYVLKNILESIKSERGLNTDIIYILSDISNIKKISNLFDLYKIHIVYHAAAYKHVPIIEDNYDSAISNNFFTTYLFAEICLNKNIDKFIFISSDKSVRPTNIMGASKRLAELSLLYFNSISNLDKNKKTKFSLVRFGNVLESSGSVVPLFKNQILKGGPITITHPDINRFFMSIEEASLLVMQSCYLTEGGEIFLLDMGKPIKITDLAHKMVKLAGLSIKNTSNLAGDIEINFIGLRPGEKLYEELLIDDKSVKTQHPYIYKSIENKLSNNEFENLYQDIKLAVNNNSIDSIKKILSNRIVGYSA